MQHHTSVPLFIAVTAPGDKFCKYGLDEWDSRVRFPAGAGNFSLHAFVQTALEPT